MSAEHRTPILGHQPVAQSLYRLRSPNYSAMQYVLLLQWRHSPHMAMAFSAVRLQISLPPASVHFLIFSSNEEFLLLFSSHLSRGLPTGLPLNFPSSHYRYSTIIHSYYMTGPL